MMLARPRSQAFTLIELLVVISIIALLIGILMPALGHAREAGRAAVCLANMRSAGQGMATYATENGDWLAGPNTSGGELTRLKSAYVFQNRPTEPTQNFDWVSPTLALSLGLPNDRSERVKAIFEEQFRCPANQATYDTVFNPGTLTVQSGSPVNSYAINANMVTTPFNNGVPTETYNYNWVTAVVEAPRDYKPRLDRIGHASLKALTLDGTRYLDHANGEVSFNGIEHQVGGGNWGVLGPALGKLVNNGEPYKWATETQRHHARRLAYRHNDALNAGFADGHAEVLSEPDSRRTELWFPSGSIVRNANDTDDPHDTNGLVLR